MQALIHENSSAVPLPKFDLFGIPPTQQMVEKDIVTEHKPITILDPRSFVQFEILTAMDEYLDLDKLFFYLKLKVKKNPLLSKPENWTTIKPVNYLLHSMIKQLDVFIGDKQISTTTPTYAYKAYIECLLGFSKSAKLSHLTSAGWFEDSLSNQMFKEYKEFEMMGKLHTDIAFQGRVLLGGIKLTIRILFNNPAFYFHDTTLNLSGEVFTQFEFLDCSLQVHRSKVPQMIVEAQNAALKIATAKYPITYSRVKPFTIQSGSTNADIDNIHSGQLPRRIFIFFVDNKAYNGDFEADPYIFQCYTINSLSVSIDGMQYPPKPYTPDFTKRLFMKEMIGLYESLDMLDGESNLKINRDNYDKGYTIFGFNFSPDLTSGSGAVGYVSPIKFGSMRLNIRFETPPNGNVTALIYFEFDKILEIDINRNAHLDSF